MSLFKRNKYGYIQCVVPNKSYYIAGIDGKEYPLKVLKGGIHESIIGDLDEGLSHDLIIGMLVAW